jgi:hypothetical protein
MKCLPVARAGDRVGLEKWSNIGSAEAPPSKSPRSELIPERCCRIMVVS